MKKFNIIITLILASFTQIYAQAPQGFNYQATVRNSSGELIVNQNVYFKFNLLQGTQTSIPIFTETHYVSTDDLGQVNLVIGEGTANSGFFSEIDWSLGSYYLGIELNTGDGYIAMGTTQLLSVPYALYAENAGNANFEIPNGIEDGDILVWNTEINGWQSTNIESFLPNPMTISTVQAYQVDGVSALSGGVIVTDGGSTITAKGVVWSISPDPDITLETKTNEGSGASDFDSYISGLSTSTNYFYRAYATNSFGTVYGDTYTLLTADATDTDLDGDGFTPNQGDCDDANENVYSGATEINDGIDNDCDGEIDEINFDPPSSYFFERNGLNTVSYSGQTTRLMQADEIYSALNDASSTESMLNIMFAGDNGVSAGFANEALNATNKTIRPRTSATLTVNSESSNEINKALFDYWINEFSNNVAPNLSSGVEASDGIAGNFNGYQLNSVGQEIDQLFFKSLIGALTLDQIINKYVNSSYLENYADDNTNGILASDKPYTEMEHKWDEGFGYLYGQVSDVTLNYGLPSDGEPSGNLLMKYFEKVEENYEPGIAETVYNAFIAGRYAITIADYDAMDAAATVIKTELSKVIGYYAIHYLNDYLNKMSTGNVSGAFHSLSEAYGFIFSIQFTNNGNDIPYLDRSTIMYALTGEGGGIATPGAYFSDFWNMNTEYITHPTQGMIVIIENAFGSLN
tara:strand:- start:413 stop:2482 length:2070 start_codon:yes stop_codon:yes gene_type:complete